MKIKKLILGTRGMARLEIINDIDRDKMEYGNFIKEMHVCV